MLFNSYIFIFIFLPITFFGYFYLNSKRLIIASKSWLLLASLFFYCWWSIDYLPLILSSILVNYAISYSMHHIQFRLLHKKTLLIIGLIFNIGLLSFYKYMDFFIENINFVLNLDMNLLHLLLPLAISFFTLQQIAFLIDSYEGLTKEKSLLDYALFVTFFPQLIAGPIVHHKEMMPQFKSIRNKIVNFDNIALGLFIFSIGLFKKVILADTFAIYVNDGFSSYLTLTMIEAWTASLSYTFQLYFDFSGYADMAIGLGLLFNIRLPINFNSPYKATNIIDFWQRWHISLTKFITTYIYTPIVKAFKKLSFGKAMFATFIAMFIAGIWHGAGWTYVVYGAIHGLALVVNNYWRKKKIKLNKYFAWFLCFSFINMALVIFRAQNMEVALNIITNMYSFNNIGSLNNIYAYLLIVMGFMITFGFKNSISYLKEFSFSNKNLYITILFIFISTIFLSRPTEFIYFQF